MQILITIFLIELIIGTFLVLLYGALLVFRYAIDTIDAMRVVQQSEPRQIDKKDEGIFMTIPEKFNYKA